MSGSVTMTGDGRGRLPVWKIRITAIIWFVLAIGCLMALPVMLDATPLLVAAAIVVALLVGALLAFVYRLIARSRAGHFLHDWLKTSLAAFMILCIAVATPVYYMALKTAADPPLIPRAVLTNGEKTVVYQGMMHIGTEQFYKQVVYDAEQALADGYVLYYEGVQPNPRGDKWFSDNLAGGGNLASNYKALGQLCGLHFQSDYFGLLQADQAEHPERHVVADVDTWQMQQEYDRLLREDPEFASKIKAELASRAADDSSGPLSNPVSALDSLTDGQLKLMGYFCRSQAGAVIQKEKQPTQMGKVVVDFRNRSLVNQILTDPHDKIYITYGADHLKGVLPLLQKADPRWRVESVTWSTPVAAPTNFEAEL